MSALVFKILPADLWQAATSTGHVAGSPVDVRDGYIHLSTAAQLRDTAVRHFAGAHDLVLVAISPESLDVRWEASRGGDLFPHLYGALPLAAVRWAKPLPLSESGQHVFPDLD